MPVDSRSRRSRRCRSAWAEHVLADGQWGVALREYMRDYNHWATIGVLNELLPAPGEPRDARRRHGRLRHAGRAVRLQRGARTTRPTWPTPSEITAQDPEGRGGAGHADYPALRAPRRRCPDGLRVPSTASSMRTSASGGCRTCTWPTAASARPRARQPGADDHGARVAPRRAAGRRSTVRQQCGVDACLIENNRPIEERR